MIRFQPNLGILTISFVKTGFIIFQRMTSNLMAVILQILAVASFIGDTLCSGVKILIGGCRSSNQVIAWIWRR